jgi:flavin reductase (DIM6/NTAB) family NADH-FMN oxidoreductase RutF
LQAVGAEMLATTQLASACAAGVAVGIACTAAAMRLRQAARAAPPAFLPLPDPDWKPGMGTRSTDVPDVESMVTLDPHSLPAGTLTGIRTEGFATAVLTPMFESRLPDKSYYAFLISAVVPRPIAFVSSQSKDGVFNLAPFSFFGLMCHDPPTLVFCTTSRAGQPKDTLANVRATGECVVNMISEHFVEAANCCCGEYPPDVDEFELSGLRKVESALPLRTPYVKEALVSMECKVVECKELTKLDRSGVGGTMITCQSERINVHPHVLKQTPNGSPYVDLAALRPISRLGANDYGRTGGIFDMLRPPSTLKVGTPTVRDI